MLNFNKFLIAYLVYKYYHNKSNGNKNLYYINKILDKTVLSK